MTSKAPGCAWKQTLVGIAVTCSVAVAILAIFLLAPTEISMGDTQRILYVHVSVAWFGLLGLVIMAVSGIGYLLRRELDFDHGLQAAAELGWLCCGLTLVTGSLWAHAAWGVWWTWDPRLTTSLVLWAIYSGCLIVRGGLEDPHQRARVGAVLAILGTLDIPLVIVATHWFRTIHPVSPAMHPSMRVTLIVSVVAFTSFFVLLLARRRAQLRLESLIEGLEPDMPLISGESQ